MPQSRPALCLQVHRAEGLSAEPADGAEVYCALTAGPCRFTTASVRRCSQPCWGRLQPEFDAPQATPGAGSAPGVLGPPQPHVAAVSSSEVFALRWDDLLVAKGRLALALRCPTTSASRSAAASVGWAHDYCELGQAQLDMCDDPVLLEALEGGACLLLALPLHAPGASPPLSRVGCSLGSAAWLTPPPPGPGASSAPHPPPPALSGAPAWANTKLQGAGEGGLAGSGAGSSPGRRRRGPGAPLQAAAHLLHRLAASITHPHPHPPPHPLRQHNWQQGEKQGQGLGSAAGDAPQRTAHPPPDPPPPANPPARASFDAGSVCGSVCSSSSSEGSQASSSSGGWQLPGAPPASPWVRLPGDRPQAAGGRGEGGELQAAAGAALSAASRVGAAGPSGVLVLSCWLQAQGLGHPAAVPPREGAPSSLPPELQPGMSLDARWLPPSSCLHSPLGHLYCQPCACLLRLRLISARGLRSAAAPPPPGAAAGPPEPAPPAPRAPGGSSSSSAGLWGLGQAAEGSAGRGGKASKAQGPGEGSGPHLSAKLAKAAGGLMARFRSHAPTPLPAPAQQGPGLQGPSPLPAPPPAAPAAAWPHLSHHQHSGSSPPRLVAAAPCPGLGDSREGGWEGAGPSLPPSQASSPPLSRQPSFTPSLLSRTSAGPGQQLGATLGPAAGSAAGLALGAGPGWGFTLGGGGEGQGEGGSQATSQQPSSRGVVGGSSASHHPHHRPASASVDGVLSALEDAGFSSRTDKMAPVAALWAKVSYAGQSHTSRMARAKQGAVSWAADPPLLLAVTRPLGGPEALEVELWGSRDGRSRGNRLLRLAAPLAELMAAGGVSSSQGEGSPGPAFYDPAHWPSGQLKLQGRMEDGVEVEVVLAVEVVDSDDRARLAGLPLLCPGPDYQTAACLPLPPRLAALAPPLPDCVTPGQPAGGRSSSSSAPPCQQAGAAAVARQALPVDMAVSEAGQHGAAAGSPPCDQQPPTAGEAAAGPRGAGVLSSHPVTSPPSMTDLEQQGSPGQRPGQQQEGGEPPAAAAVPGLGPGAGSGLSRGGAAELGWGSGAGEGGGPPALDAAPLQLLACHPLPPSSTPSPSPSPPASSSVPLEVPGSTPSCCSPEALAGQQLMQQLDSFRLGSSPPPTRSLTNSNPAGQLLQHSSSSPPAAPQQPAQQQAMTRPASAREGGGARGERSLTTRPAARGEAAAAAPPPPPTSRLDLGQALAAVRSAITQHGLQAGLATLARPPAPARPPQPSAAPSPQLHADSAKPAAGGAGGPVSRGQEPRVLVQLCSRPPGLAPPAQRPSQPSPPGGSSQAGHSSEASAGSSEGAGGAGEAGPAPLWDDGHPPGQLPVSVLGWMDLVLHGVDMLPATAAAGAPPPSALAHTASSSNSSRVRAAAGGGVGGSDPMPREASGHKAAGSSSSAGSKAAAAAAAASSDCFVIIQCGPYWAVSSARPCGPSPPRWALHLRLPLLHPATSLSLALFRRHEASSSRKLLSLMSPLAAPGEVLVGKLRLRAGALVPGRLVLAAALPLLGERSQSKGPLQTAVCHMSLKVTYPQLLPVLSAYLAPPLYAPLLLLAMGCTAGDDLQDPCLGNPGLAAPEEEQVRRLKRVALSWLNAGGPPPGIPYRAARRLLDDGRQDFSLSRTQQNWRRLTAVLGSAGPALQWWKEVQSWRNPLLSAAVAAGIVAAAAYPSRALALALLALALRLWYWKEMVLGEGCGQPLHMLVDASDTLPAAPTPAAPSASQQQQQQQQQPGGMAGVQGAGAGSVDAEQLMDCAWGTHGSVAPAPAAAYAAPPSSSSPAAGGELEAGAAPLSASVPLDPLAAMRAQWDSMRGFMLTVQNVMDGVASAGERMAAVASWHDPTATTLLLLGLISGALLLWLAGLPVLMAAALLFDIRPPPFRDPFPPPPANLVAYMPCRADRMM